MHGAARLVGVGGSSRWLGLLTDEELNGVLVEAERDRLEERHVVRDELFVGQVEALVADEVVDVVVGEDEIDRRAGVDVLDEQREGLQQLLLDRRGRVFLLKEPPEDGEHVVLEKTLKDGRVVLLIAPDDDFRDIPQRLDDLRLVALIDHDHATELRIQRAQVGEGELGAWILAGRRLLLAKERREE